MLKKTVVSSILLTLLSPVAIAGSFGNFDVSLTAGMANLNWDNTKYFSSSPSIGNYTSSYIAELQYTTEKNFFFSNTLSVAYYRDLTIYDDSLTVGYYFNPLKYLYIAPYIGVGIQGMDTSKNTTLVAYVGQGKIDYTLPTGVSVTVPLHEKVYLSAKITHSLDQLTKGNFSNYSSYGVGLTYKFDNDKIIDSLTLKGAYYNKDSSALNLYAGGYALALTITF